MRFDLRPGVRRLFRLSAPTTRTPLDADVDDELEALIANRVEHLVARGMSPDEAAPRPFADSARRSTTRATNSTTPPNIGSDACDSPSFLESVMQDVHYAARGLARRPAFTTVAVLTLAIGVGATTAIFSAVNVLLLRPLPYARPDELMKLSLVVPPRGDEPQRDEMVWSYPKYTVFRDAQHVVQRPGDLHATCKSR